MFTRNGIQYEFHHMGVPTQDVKPNERYNSRYGVYTSDSECGLVHIQWHRFNPDSCLDPILRTLPHPAFKVNDLSGALHGHRVLVGPYEPIEGFHVAIIEDGGMPIEFIQTTLTDDEIWERAKSNPASTA
jgi:hypothetical protein